MMASAAVNTSLPNMQLAYSDALPYYDTDMDHVPGLRDAVEREIAREKQSMKYDPLTLLPPAMPLFQQHPHLAAEIERKERGEDLNVLDTSRYQLQPPAQGLEASTEEWSQALQNAETQLAHMDHRLKNIELLRRYGEAMLHMVTDAQQTVEEDTNELNRERQSMHLRLGDKLSTLDVRWRDLVSQNLSIKVANLTARAEIEEYRRRTEEVRHELALLDQAES